MNSNNCTKMLLLSVRPPRDVSPHVSNSNNVVWLQINCRLIILKNLFRNRFYHVSNRLMQEVRGSRNCVRNRNLKWGNITIGSINKNYGIRNLLI